MSRKPGREELAHWASEFGTDEEFRLWVSHQPSCLSGAFSEYHQGVGRNVACHIRTVAGGAGSAIKPPFSCVPMTDAEHRLTHAHGNGYFHPPEWWQDQVEGHLQRWIETRES